MTRKAKIPVAPAVPAGPAIPLSQRIGWRPLAIFVLTVVAYSTAVTSPLLFDDQNSITSNASIRQLTPLQGPLSPPRDTPVAGRPFVNLTFAINYATDGIGVRAYHVTNVLIHLVVAWLLFGVIRRGLGLPRAPVFLRSKADSVALAASLLWALHPLNSEVVNYLSQRSESLMALCYLLTIYAAIRAHEVEYGLKWTVVAILSCAAGMASKESMVTAPVMVMVIDRVLVFSSWREAMWARRGLYAGLIAGWVVLGAILWTAPRSSAGFTSLASSWNYLLNQAVLITRYLGLVIWPHALVLDYGLPRPLDFAQVWPQFLFLGACLLMTALALWRAPVLGLLGAWFFITLSPASSVIPVATEVGAERRMYLPLMALTLGLVLLVVYGLARLDHRRRVPGGLPVGPPPASRLGAALLVVACMALFLGVQLRNRDYVTPLTMAQTIVERWPNGRGHFLLASELVLAGRHDEAMAQFRESAKDYPGALFALGAELVNAGQTDEGVRSLEAFIKAQPDHPVVIPARELLSSVYLGSNRADLAGEQLRLLLARVPTHASARRLMGDLRLQQNDPTQAIVEYRESLRIRPGQADTLGNLGFALAALNRFDEAVEVLRETVVLSPGDPSAHLLLGRVLSVLKKYEEAQAEFQAAVAIDPNNRDAKNNLESLQRLLANRTVTTTPVARP